MVKSILIETQFLPSIEFFCAVSAFDQIEIEHFEHYVKQSYRNHARINTANGAYKLIVPLSSKGNRTLIKDIKIDYSTHWITNFCKTVESAYRKSPFYEHYIDELRHIVFKKEVYLVDLNLNLLEQSLKWLQWEIKIITSKEYNKIPISSDYRNVLLSKKTYSSRNIYMPVPYTQVFGSTFVENLSIVDLIFCKGPEASGIIKTSSLNL